MDLERLPQRVGVLDAGRPATVQEDPAHERPRPDNQIGAVRGRPQVGSGGAVALAVTDVAVEQAHSVESLAVEVPVER
jgi:hypothetical protein